MTTLLIDVGNSRVKAALLEQGKIHSSIAIGYEKNKIASYLDSELDSKLEPQRVLVSNVAGDAVAGDLALYVEQRWSLCIEFVEVAGSAAGVTNGYRDYKSLGADRWSAIVAAWSRYRAALCVVDCGTALTIDLVSVDGQHLGGFILPGLELMSASLGDNTEQIAPVIGKLDASPQPGNNTDSCIVNGALASITSLIESSFEQLGRSQEQQCYCIVTGGNAEQIRDALKIKVDHDPYLVLRGVAILLETIS